MQNGLRLSVHCYNNSLAGMENNHQEFKQLWNAGFKATLTIEAVNGEASIVLKSGLGAHQPQHHHRHHGQARAPAYHRRQERSQAARLAADEQGISPTVEVRDSTIENADLPAAKAREALDETTRTASC